MVTPRARNFATYRRWFAASLLVLGAAALSLSGEVKALGVGGGTVLYDANSAGSVLPDAPAWAWSYGAIGVASFKGMQGGATVLETSDSVQAGYNKIIAAGLASDVGFSLDVSLRMVSESHVSNNRSGFSIIVLDNAARGVELSFWSDEVWLKNGDAAFSHNAAEAIGLDTTSFERTYRITFLGSNYTLAIDGLPAFGGALRDYATHASFPASIIYNTPNYIFFGDNTTAAGARFELSHIALAPVPEPGTWGMMLAALGLVACAARRRAC